MGYSYQFTYLVNLYGVTAPTAFVTRAGAGVDSVWEQEKLEARKLSKMPPNPQRRVLA